MKKAALFLTCAAIAVPAATQVPVAPPGPPSEPPPAMLHPMFQDHAVLQRGMPIPIYGNALSGTEVTVTLGRSAAHARADTRGHWRLTLPAMPAGGPYELTARAAGQDEVAHDVMVGDVLLCSGQSNMAFEVRQSANAAADIAASKDDGIRSLSIATKDSAVPLDRFATPVKWLTAAPETTGRFSASCYFTARELHKTSHAPIGMVVAAWGGSRVRSWISEPGLRRAGLETESLNLLDKHRTDPVAADRGWDTVWERWWHSLGIAGTAPWSPEFDDRAWATAPVALGPWALWNGTSPDGFTGQMWLRSSVTLTAQQAAQPAILDLGVTNEEDESWVNGHGVGGTSWSHSAQHPVPAGVLHAGANSITTNIFCSWRNCGMTGPASARAIRLADGSAVPLAGPWRYAQMPAEAIAPQLPWGPAHGTSVIYNGMIAPIRQYGFKSVIWYQGESDVHFAPDYQRLLQTLIADWRQRFEARLPFLVVQLPEFGPKPSRAGPSTMAEIREAQRRAVSGDPRADYIVTMGLGDPANIHPTNKQEVGRRIAAVAENLDGAHHSVGPRPGRAVVAGNIVTVRFTDVTGELSASGKPGQFELCGKDDASCRWVDARLVGPASVAIPIGAMRPTRVRFCWGDSPACTLSDKSGLPAAPFELALTR